MGYMGKLVMVALIILTLFHLVLAVGATAIFADKRSPGDGYFLIYALLGLILGISSLFRQICGVKPAIPVSVFKQVIIMILLGGMSLCGLMAAAGLALYASRPNLLYAAISVFFLVLAAIGGLIIRFIGRKYSAAALDKRLQSYL